MSGAVVRQGPYVRSGAHIGAVLIIVGVAQFAIVGNALTQLYYPHYSLLTNYISDLGNTATSPWHLAFNVSIILLGLLAIPGTLLIWDAFRPGLFRLLGLSFLWIAEVGAIFVGLFPENVNGTVHGLASLVVFLFAGLSMLVLAGAMLRDTRWHGYRAFSAIFGLVTLAALVGFLLGHWGPLGPGGVERIVVYPVLIWGVAIGARILGTPALASRRRLGVP